MSVCVDSSVHTYTTIYKIAIGSDNIYKNNKQKMINYKRSYFPEMSESI